MDASDQKFSVALGMAEPDAGQCGDPRPQWLADERYQTVLRATNTVAFEFNPLTRVQHVSPFIGEFVAGNYDGRLLSDVMLTDGVIHPHDIKKSLNFLEQAKAGGAGSITLRLLTPAGEYRWFRMCLCPCDSAKLMVGVLSDVDAEMRQSRLLRYRAEYDPVSGIYNKMTFFESTQRLLESEPDSPHFLLRFDIDRFKIVNELYTTDEGDKVLRHIGDVIHKLARPGETYARMGDDIFCMCLSRPEAEVLRLIDLLGNQINHYPMAFQFVLSAGILRIPRYGGLPVNILCDRAAMAQRRVKGSFVNRYAFYEDWMGASLNREHKIVGYMQQALEEGQFEFHLQPKYDMQTGNVIGAESLARWRHPTEGMISPGDFIPLFERNGFILQLDEYIWDKTYQMMRRWLDHGKQIVPISVNVSRTHLHDPRFCDKVLALSKKYRLPPALMEMEITESAYIESPQTLYEIMEQMQSAGFRFLMDDFGSGYSSLNVLKDIPVDIIKIDLNFLQNARRGEKVGRNVLRATVRLVKDMELPIIAEGVETEEQAKFLLSVGCACAQGYYFARPMPPEEFERLLPNIEAHVV